MGGSKNGPALSAATRQGWYAATLAFLGSLAVVILITNQAVERVDTGVLAVTIALAVYTSARLCWIAGTGEIRPIAATFWMFCFTALACAPLAQVTLDRYPFLVDHALVLPATLLVAAGCIAWDLGYLFAPYVPKMGPRSAPQRLRQVNDRRLLLVGVGGVCASAVYIASVGPARFFQSRRDLAEGLASYRENGQAASGFLQAFGQVPVFVAFALLTCVLIRDPDRRTGRAKLAWLTLLAVNVVVNNPISNARFWFITVALGLLFALPTLGSRGFRAIVVGGVVAALVVFPYSDYFRVEAGNRTPLQTDSIVETLAVKDFDQVIMTANAMWWIDARGGHTYGEQALGAALFFVPRAVWPEKPIDTGVEVGRAMRNAANVNLSSPLWAELYVDFGWIGTILGFGLLGVLARRGDELFLLIRQSVRRRAYVIDLVIPAVAAYEFILLRGPLLQAMSRLSVLLLVLWFVRARATEAGPVRETAQRRPRTRRPTRP